MNPRPAASSWRAWAKLAANRLRCDFQLAVVTLMGSCAALAIAPFCVYRLLQGQWAVAAADALLVLGIAGAAAYAWVSGQTHRVGAFLVIVNTSGCVVISQLIGLSGLFWSFPVILANFFLTSRRPAVLANCVLLLALMWLPGQFGDVTERILYLVTATVMLLFAFIVSHLTEEQRERLQDMADRDPLTGLRNRRSMERELNVMLARRASDAQGLLMLDIDHFKSINDRFGHEAGDQVLVAVAQLLEAQLRDADRIYRFGGEEFVLWLPGADSEQLALTGERLRHAVEAQPLIEEAAITVSLGGAVREADEDLQHWLVRADAALYRAKGAGRNRVEMAATDTASAGQAALLQ